MCSLRNYTRDCRNQPIFSPTQRRRDAINSAISVLIEMRDWSVVGTEDIFGNLRTDADHEDSIRLAVDNLTATLARTPEQELDAERAADEEMDEEMASGLLRG
jgi:hypothetical protein